MKIATFLNYLKQNKAFLLGILVLCWVVFVNIFPKGYVFGGGDTFQIMEAKSNFLRCFFEWESRAVWFYLIFYLLDILGVGETVQLSFYLGIFIFGAYFSFYLFSRLIFRDTSQGLSVLVALFYALNLYTFFIFTGNWGYSYFPSLYIFLPLLIAGLLRFLEKKSLFWIAVFSLVLFLASSGFGNVAFALSFGIFSCFLMIFLGLTGFLKVDKLLAKRFLFLILFSFLVSSHWLLPSMARMKSGVAGITSSEHVIEFDYIIKKVASPISNTLSLINYTGSYFPHKFPNKVLATAKPLFFVLAFLPVILIVLRFFRTKSLKTREKKLFYAFFALLLLFVMLTAKARAPFEIINHYIYHIWGFSTLRGFDKTGIYIPFLLAVLLLISFKNFKYQKAGYLLMLFILLIPLPFYTGKIQQNIGYRLSEKRDYQQANLSFLVKIPDEYYKIRDIINSDSRKSFLATLPISRNDGSGIVSYPKWKFYGADITRELYSKRSLEANRFYFSHWNFAGDFNSQVQGDFSWIVKLLGVMNANYLLYHKDVEQKYVENSHWKLDILVKDGLLKQLEDNQYFSLYQINKEYVLDYLTWQTERIPLETNADSVNNKFETIKNSSQPAEFQELNPKKFLIRPLGNATYNKLILAEKFDPFWRAYAFKKNGQKRELKTHFKARGYANGWEIENPQNIDKIIIEYYPVKLMWRGIWLSLASVIFLSAYLIKYFYDKKRTVKKV